MHGAGPQRGGGCPPLRCAGGGRGGRGGGDNSPAPLAGAGVVVGGLDKLYPRDAYGLPGVTL